MTDFDLQTLNEQLDAIAARLDDDVRPCVDEAANRAEDAEGYAYSARDSCADAESCAEDAKHQAQSAMQYLNELQSEIQALQAQIKDALGTSGEHSLQADIRKWRVQVIKYLNNGVSHSKIAAHLGISEFLVQCIEDERKKAA